MKPSIRVLAIVATAQIAAFNANASITSEQAGIHEVRTQINASEWPDFLGGTMVVEQKLIENSKGEFVYRFSDQSADTQQYHQAFCADLGMDPAMGESITKGEGSAAWHCSDEQPSSGLEPRSTDYVFARAPSGQVPVGQNFYAQGTVSYTSSVAGAIEGSVQVDNGRCSTLYRQHYASPFSGNHTARVICIAHSPQQISTRMNGCIPRTCGNDVGSLQAR
ncbi:TPA: hypothetical protein QDZ42_000854 [Stenotrophomonas maltophilia]|nr:hypothetical protein [Stenotrophomonas maltophilia]HDS1042231.1 hypothetical protein [Stenotrophomonas maltophilia]